ncbi:TPA: helix-turn-helix domain-containing protein [Vibrio parahaemolyticus]
MNKRDAVQAALGERVGYLRKKRGLKQSQLAERSGISSSRLCQIERGKANPSFMTLFSLADTLGCDVSTLVSIGYFEIFRPQEFVVYSVAPQQQQALEEAPV